MSRNEKDDKMKSVAKKDKKSWAEKEKDNFCTDKAGDNCKEPGVFGDSEPIGGGG